MIHFKPVCDFHSSAWDRLKLTNIASEKKKVLSLKFLIRNFGEKKPEPIFTNEANPGVVGLQNSWPLLQGDDEFQTARSCSLIAGVIRVGVKWDDLPSLGFKVDPFFLLHMEDTQSKEIEIEMFPYGCI